MQIHLTSTPNVPRSRALRSLVNGTWCILKGSSRVRAGVGLNGLFQKRWQFVKGREFQSAPEYREPCYSHFKDHSHMLTCACCSLDVTGVITKDVG